MSFTLDSKDIDKNVQQYMQDAHLNSGTPIFRNHIWAQFVSREFWNNQLSQAKCFHFKSQIHIEH